MSAVRTITIHGVTYEFPGSEVIANVTLTGGEAQLGGIQIGEDKYAIPDAGITLTFDSIYIATPPTKTAYTYGEVFDTTGMVVKARYTYEGVVVGEKTVTSYTYSSALVAGQTSVIITYAEDGVSKTAEQAITVAKANPTAPSLSKSAVTLNEETGTDTVTVTRQGDGAVEAVSSDSSIVSATVNGTTITLTALDTSADATVTITVTIAAGTNYNAYTTPTVITVTVEGSSAGGIYGVTWDGTSTTSWTRTDDAANFTDPVPYVAGATSYGSPFDTISPWQDMVVVEDAEAGTMVKIPKFWYLLEQSGAGMSIKISPVEQDGYAVCPACMDRGDGAGERDYILVGRYHCTTASGANFKSVTGVTPQANITRSTARTAIHNLGSTVWQYDWATRFTIWLLYLVEYANWNSQATIGYGCGNNSSAGAVGYTDSMPYHTGTTQSNRTTYGLGTQYRNIEGLLDNVRDWVDGCYNASNGLNIIMNPANNSDSTGGTSVGTPSNGFPSAFTVKDVSGTFPLFIATSANGSDSTYSCDNWTFGASNPCVGGGGNYYQGQNYGLFCSGGYGAAFADAVIGCRSMKLPSFNT